MHISLRYHVASIIGVLCSLVLGILIGGALFQDDRLVKEQGMIIAELEGQFSQMKAALAELTERERLVGESWEKVRGTLVNGLLANETVVLVSDPSAVEWGPIKAVLRSAGAAYRELSWQDLMEAEDLQADLIVAWLGEAALTAELLAAMQELIAAGVHVTFLQGLTDKGSFPELTALCIDMADTFLGELALVFGLAGRAAGHYGIKNGASRVLPEVDPGL
ncbi:MAG: copper transporter [Firmicutes bacterium]|nr:copper transporter [Bacillota bacterium]